MSRSKPEMMTGQEAVEHVNDIWQRKTGKRAPVEKIKIRNGRPDHNYAAFDDGTVTVSEQMKKGYVGVFERNLLEAFDEAFEEVLEEEVNEQLDILEERYLEAVDDFDADVSDVQVAELDSARAQHGSQVSKNHGTTFTLGEMPHDVIAFDYSVLHRVDPTAEEGEQTDFYIPQLARHEATHGIQRAMNPDFRDVWKSTGRLDIGRATTEGMARYEEHKGSGKSRKAKIAAQEKPWMMPVFWKNNVASESATPTNPYAYGELAAYFIEEGHRKRFAEEVANSVDEDEPVPAIRTSTLESVAENRTRETLLKNPSKDELDYRVKQASAVQDNLFYGQAMDSIKDLLVDSGDLDYHTIESMSDRLIDEVELITETSPSDSQLNKWYEASAVDQIYQEFRDQRLEISEELHSAVSEFEKEHLGYFN